MDIKYFTEFNTNELKIDAGFTTKPDEAIRRRTEMVGRYKLVVRPKLVHGIDICIIDKDALNAGNKQGCYLEVEECDGLVTNLKDICLTSTHGDCIPVYAFDPVKNVIGLAHAGWRGTADCVVSNLIMCMTEEYGCRPKDIKAVIGPGIGACCFEVDADVVDYFTGGMPWTEEYIYAKPVEVSASQKYLVDLKVINSELLQIEGIRKENIFIDNSCTCCDSERFWSYRRDKDTNRMLAYITMRP